MDKLILGLEVTLIGLVIVFVMLMLIIGVVKVIALAGGFVDKKTEQMNAKKAAKKAAKAAQEAKEEPVEAAFAPEPVVVSEPAPVDDTELIAVIAAAVAAAMEAEGAEEPTGFVVRSIRRINNAPAWNHAGREE